MRNIFGLIFLLYSAIAYTQCLKGIYTVGNGKNYSTLQAAINDLDTKGICGAVEFKISSGIHAGKTTLPATLGLTSTNTLTVSGDSLTPTQLFDNSSPIATDNFVLLVKGQSYITFKYLVVTRSGSPLAYTTVIEIADNASNIQFLNCEFKAPSNTSNSLLEEKSLLHFDSTIHNNIILENCKLTYGGSGIYYDNKTGSKARNWGIKNNIFSGVVGNQLKFTGIQDISINTNEIIAYYAISNLIAVSLKNCSGDISIKNNNIRNNSGRALYLDDIQQQSNSPTKILNNSIYIQSSAYNAIEFSKVDYINFYNNNVHKDIKTNVLVIKNSHNVNLINNIFNGGKQSLEIDNINAISQSNYNNWHTLNGQAVFKYGSSVANDLKTWQQNTNNDLASLSLPLKFIYSGKYRVPSRENLLFDNKGAFLNSTSKDILGKTRNTIKPDIGAFEFDSYKTKVVFANNGFSVERNVCPGLTHVSLKIVNKGTDTIKQVSIRLKSGDYQKTFLWKGNLASLDTSASITIDTFNFEKNVEYELYYFLENPNNDTTVSTVSSVISGVKTKLSGDYLVYGHKYDYATLDDAIADIKTRGYCDTVRFKIANGQHKGNWDLTNITAQNPNDLIIFQPEYNDPERCILTSNSSVNSVFTLKNSKGFVFKGFGFRVYTKFAPFNIFRFLGGCGNISIDKNIFIMTDRPVRYGGNGLGNSFIGIQSSFLTGLNNSISITNNSFTNNETGVYVARTTPSSADEELTIANNTFFNQIYSSIYVENRHNVTIKNNTINTTKDTFNIKLNGPWAAIELKNCKDFTVNNNIIAKTKGLGLRLEKDSGKINPLTIFNNSITAPTPVSLYRTQNTQFYFNTFRSNGEKTNSVINSTQPKLVEFRNNILTHNDSGRLYDSLNINYRANNNVYFTKGNKISLSDSSLAQLNAKGFDSSSVIYAPNFFTKSDNHFTPTNSITNVGLFNNTIVRDLDGKLRSINPTPGAYETSLSLAAKVSITNFSPQRNNCGYKPFLYLNLKNKSLTDTLYFAVIKYKINKDLYDSIIWRGKLPPSDTIRNIPIKKHIFDYDSTYTLKAWAELANFQLPKAVVLDTFVSTHTKYRLKGNYTIGGVSPDFISVPEAISALYKSGVCGDINFSIRKDKYLQYQLMDGIVKGMGTNFWVSFEGESNDSTDVEFTYAYDNDTSVFEFRNLKHIRLANISFNTNRPDLLNQRGIRFITSVGENIVERCHFYSNLWYEGDSGIIRKNHFLSRYSSVKCIACKATTVNDNNFNEIGVNFKYGENNIIKNNVFYSLLGNTFTKEKNFTIINNRSFTNYISPIAALDSCYSGKILKNSIYEYNSVLSVGNINNISPHINIKNSNGTKENPILVANNIIYTNAVNAGIVGVGANRSTYINIYHNTMYFDYLSSRARNNVFIDTKKSSHINVANNIFGKLNDYFFLGYNDFVIDTDSLSSFDYFDNNFYSIRDSFSRHFLHKNNPNNFITHKQWVDSTGFDKNSTWGALPDFLPAKKVFKDIIEEEKITLWYVSLNRHDLYAMNVPFFSQNYDWKVTSPLSLGFLTDLEDKPRDTVNPSYGAIEYVPQKVNAGVLGWGKASPQLCDGESSLVITLKNYGTDTLKSVIIKGTIDSTSIQQNWTGSLAKGETESVVLLNQNISFPDSFIVHLWTEQPNGVLDEYNILDTVNGKFMSSMNGTYTLGGQSPNYDNFHQFVADLTKRGVCGPVTLEVRPGTYFGKYIINDFKGVSEINTVTIISSTRDSSSVVFLDSNYTNANFRDRAYVFYLNGTKHWRFKHVGFLNTNLQKGAFTRCVVVNNTNYDLDFYHCSFGTLNKLTSYFDNTHTTLLSISRDYQEGGKIGDIDIIACSFNNSERGIYAFEWNHDWDGVDTIYSKIKIDSCIFNNQTSQVLSLGVLKKAQISNNVVFGTPLLGFKIDRVRDTLLVYNNRILSARNSGMFFTSLNFKTKGIGRVYNNEITTKWERGYKNAFNSVGFLLVDGIDFVNNSISQKIGGAKDHISYDAPYVLTASRSTSLNLKNNLFTNAKTGRIFYFDSLPVSAPYILDYNLWDTKDTFAKVGNTFYSNFASWKTTTGLDNNSLIEKINFIDTNRLRYTNANLKDKGTPIPYVIDDINGNTRSAVPEIGCYEFDSIANLAIIDVSPKVSCSDSLLVEARFINKGNNTVTFLEYDLLVNGNTTKKGNKNTVIAPKDTSGWIALEKIASNKTSNTVAVKITRVNYISDNDTTDNYLQQVISYFKPKAHALGKEKEICANDTAILSPGSFIKYQWSTGEKLATIKVTQPKTIYFNLVDSNQCEINDSILIKIDALVSLINDTTLCNITTYTLHGGSFNNYLWSDSTTDSTLKINKSGNYWLHGTSLAGCKSTDSVTINLGVEKPILVKGNGIISISNYTSNYNYTWAINDTIITGSSSATQNITKPGKYLVEVTDNGVCTADASINVLALSANQYDAENSSIKIYPNPTSSKLYFEINSLSAGAFDMSLTDIQGKNIFAMSSPIKQGLNIIATVLPETIKSGVYFCRLTTPNGVFMRKIIKH